MSITNEDLNEFNSNVVRLVEESTNLVNEIAGQKQRFDGKLATATTKASEANASATAANSHRTAAMNAETSANSHASRAELAALRAEEVSGLATVGQAVSQALADGGYTWRTEADMIAMREQNNAMFAASGFVHFGKGHYSSLSNNVNDGLFSYSASGSTAFAAVLNMGRLPGATSLLDSEKSKSNVASVNIVGFTTDLQSQNDSDSQYGGAFQIKLPPAESGTRTYDSSTGVSIDYAKEVDPEFGNVAADHNEAVKRAFNAVSPMVSLPTPDSYISDGWYKGTGVVSDLEFNPDGSVRFTSPESQEDAYVSYYCPSITFKGGETYRISVDVEVVGLGGVPRIGFASKDAVSPSPNSSFLNGDDGNAFFGRKKFVHEVTVSTVESFYQLVFGSRNDVSRTFIYHSIVIENVNKEVVTKRQDIFGLEGFFEKISPEKPFIYKHGVIHSRASDIDGIATVSSNRPESYYAAFDGDTTSRGSGVNFLALSVIEQDHIANNPKNHIYRMANGDIVQWRIRQRTIAGVGNGSWDLIDSIDEQTSRLAFNKFSPADSKNNNVVSPQGIRDIAINNRNLYGAYACEGKDNWKPTHARGGKSKGVFVAQKGSGDYSDPYELAGYNGECYFLVCGVVSRLNQGAYHPDLNPEGCALWRIEGSGYREWHHSQIVDEIKSQSDCFRALNDGWSIAYGSIASGGTGRADQYSHFDAIYAGQVHDMRLSAWGVTDYGKSLTDAISRDIGGATRGKGRVPFTAIIPVDDADLIRYGSGPQIRTSSNANDEDLTRNPHLIRALERYVGAENLGNLGPTLANEGTPTSTTAALDGKGKSYLCFDVEGEAGTRVYQITGVTYGSDVCGLVGVGATPELEVTVTPVSGSAFIMWCLGDHMGSQYAPITELVNRKASAYYDIIPHIDAVGHPRAIAEKFPDGFSGQWIAFDYDKGANYNQLELNRKKTSTSLISLYHDGASWLKRPISFDDVLNKPTWGGPISSVELWHYETPADFTEKSDNLAVVGGLGDVATLNHCKAEKGNRLHFSLISEVGKGQFNSSSFEFLPMVSYQIGSTSPDKLETATTIPHSHAPMSGLLSAVNAPGAIKTLAHLVEKKGQLFVQHHATQLLHSGENWGDDSQVTIVNNESTKTDDNGNVVKVVTHTGINPIGWVKNEI